MTLQNRIMIHMVKNSPEYIPLKQLLDRKCGRDIMMYICSFLFAEGKVRYFYEREVYTWNDFHEYGWRIINNPWSIVAHYVNNVPHGPQYYHTGMSPGSILYNRGDICWQINWYDSVCITIYVTHQIKDMLRRSNNRCNYRDHRPDCDTYNDCYCDRCTPLSCNCLNCKCEVCTFKRKLTFDGYNWSYDGKIVHMKYINPFNLNNEKIVIEPTDTNTIIYLV